MIPWPQLTALDTQISLALVMAEPWDTNIVAFEWPLVATWTRDINTEPSRTTDPDMVLGKSPGQVVTMAPGMYFPF